MTSQPLVVFGDGRLLRVDEFRLEGTDRIVLELAGGGSMTIPLELVERIVDDEYERPKPGNSGDGAADANGPAIAIIQAGQINTGAFDPIEAILPEVAEAMAEHLHHRVRLDWGYGREESLSLDDVIAEKYRGIRPAPGYPACPDHTEKDTLFRLLDATAATGIRLTESYAMSPAAAVCGWYFAHPESKYFAVDRITRDQVEAYARRKGMSVGAVERWLAPNLGYDTV